MGIIDYTHVICLFLTQNDRKLAHHKNIHAKKCFNLCLEFSKVSHDPDKIIFNYSSYTLTKSEKRLLCKGLNFAIPPDKLEYLDYLLPFELLYRDIKDLDLPNEKTNFLKAKIKDCALSSFKLYNEKGAVSSLNKDEINALKTLSKNKDLIIQKSDKGNSIVLINKSDYLDKMYNIQLQLKKFNIQFNLQLKIVSNSLRKYVNKILNTLWLVLTLSPFSPIYHWRKLLKSVVTPFIRIKNCCVTSVKISLRNFYELHVAATIFCLMVVFINKLMG